LFTVSISAMVHYPARIGLKELGVYGGEPHV
jgi:hypothetical protein